MDDLMYNTPRKLDQVMIGKTEMTRKQEIAAHGGPLSHGCRSELHCMYRVLRTPYNRDSISGERVI